ncbi:LPS export ABC transporter periplasmic protein LptC [Persephonella atlantica]|uniref:LPS export ABC transporter periplasmic protein LptC n=1 Tax=Persephonella atlantica TaxID=2699429 RepID=A0ABS1GES3_9AQUI|nr:LPS export ABC transporter periplasmic protein LptC [Persephonella atlantica]
MKSKIIFYVLTFFLVSLIFSKITELFEKEKLKNLRYQSGVIQDFTLIGVNSDRYILKGKKIVEKKAEFIIDGFDLVYKTPEEDVYIKADRGIYNKKKDTLDLFRNVRILTKDMKLKTEFLTILVNERRAFNSSPVEITGKEMFTEGRNIFIKLKDETLKLEDVKTVFRGG